MKRHVRLQSSRAGRRLRTRLRSDKELRRADPLVLSEVLPSPKSVFTTHTRNKANTHVEEHLEVPAEARDRARGGEERPDGVRAVRARVEVPRVTREREVRRDGDRLPVRAVLERDRARVEVGEPDHDLVHVRAPRGVGREEVVRDVGDDRARRGLRPLPGGLGVEQAR